MYTTNINAVTNYSEVAVKSRHDFTLSQNLYNFPHLFQIQNSF